MNHMNHTIKSRKLSQTLTFSRPGSSYIFVDLNGKEGTLGKQICDGGYLAGNTISYSGDRESVFERICRNWYRNYIKKELFMFVY